MNKIVERAIQMHKEAVGGLGCVGDPRCECFACELRRYADPDGEPEDPSEASEEMCVVVYGNPFDGLTLVGPFMDAESANMYAEGHRDDWSVVSLEQPEEDFGSVQDVLQEVSDTLNQACFLIKPLVTGDTRTIEVFESFLASMRALSAVCESVQIKGR